MQSSLRFPSPLNMGDNNSLSLGGYSSPCLILKNEVAGSLPPSTLRWLRDRERAYPPHSFKNNGVLGACGTSFSAKQNSDDASSGDVKELETCEASFPAQPNSNVAGASKIKARFHPIRRMTGAGANRERMLQQIKNRLYQQLHPTGYSDVALEHGFSAIFNLEFSPGGEVLVAACEGKSMLLFDPISMKHINTVPNAHSDCINTFRFLDSRTFASGSDDTTVALWDIRNLKHRIRTLRGHNNWVKSIEYCSRDGLLVTSAFDGNVYTWDINRYEEEGTASFKRVFHIESLMRTRLTPDCTKLVMSTDVGFYIVIHDLDLDTLNSDLMGFKPMDYYDAMTEENTMQENSFNRVFHANRNRVELVMDFPPESYPWSISSLVIHPQGWCMMSRYTTENEDYEWTCVHDLQSNRNSLPEDDSDSKQSDDSSNDSIETEASSPSPPFTPTNRLLYHITEPNDGRGYIKELSVSPDGRLLCSSFGHGVRLLSFDQNCSELCDVYPTEPKELCHLKLIVCHRHTVLTSRFSPTHCLLATGCLNGRVVFHQPRL